jgi:pimeloyl-ACP methyl ester carboxylesterase
MIDRGTSCWVVHVHGQGSDRRQTLRGVESATTLGLSSLIVSYRNDGEGPRSRDGRSHLGESEWRDLEAALRFVAERGGTECVVFGWSLGATIALNTVQRSPLGTMIKGIAMVSPVLAWEEVLRANARHQGLPQFLGSLAAGLLSSKGVSRLAGLDAPLEVLESDRARLAGPLTVPVLILHNRNDWSVPIETSSRFAQAHKDLVELVPFDCSGHTQEWNSDRVGWDLAVRRWYGRLFQPGPAEDYVAAGWRMNLDGDEFMVGGGTPRDRLERAETLARKVNLLLDVVVAEGGAPYEFADIQAGVREHGYELSRTRWWRIRSGESPEVVPKEALVALAKFFEVDPAYLTDEAGELPQRIERELQFLKKMRRNKLKNIAARTLGDIDIKTLEAINALLDDVDSYDRNDPERG